MMIKEKFVGIFELFFEGEDPSKGPHAKKFWDDLLLLRTNPTYLERCMTLTSERDLLRIAPALHVIFFRCCAAIKSADNSIRTAHAIHILTILFKELFRKRFPNFGTDILAIIAGEENANLLVRELLHSLQSLLGDVSTRPDLKKAALVLLLVLASATDNINQNILLEYFMVVDLYDTIVGILEEGISAQHWYGDSALILLAIVFNYRKYESQNPYLRHVRREQRESALHAIALSVSFVFFGSSHLLSMNRIQSNAGMVGKMGSWIAGWFTTQEVPPSVLSGKQLTMAISSLLVMYEYIHTCPKFHTHVGAGGGSLGESELSSLPPETEQLWIRYLRMNTDAPRIGDGSHSPLSLSSGVANGASVRQGPLSSPLLRDFVSFCAFVLRDSSPVSSVQLQQVLGVLCLIGITDHPSIQHILHSTNFEPHGGNRVTLNVPEYKILGGKSLVSAVLDMVVGSLRIHTKRQNTDILFFRRCLCVVHRIICYQHTHVVRLSYKWRKLWDVLIRTLRSLSSVEPRSRKVLEVCLQVTTIFNLFITYGDQFAHPSDYDELYYELIRNKETIESFCNVMDGNQKEGELGRQLTQQVENFRTILVHFSTKLDYWSSTHGHSSLTPEEVLTVIQRNYGSLKLNLLENLAVHFPYSENPQEVPFFRNLTRQLMSSERLFLTVPVVRFEFEKNKKF